MIMNTKQGESYSTVSHSTSSHPAADNASQVLPISSTTTIHHTEKNVGQTSHVFPINTGISDHTQLSIKGGSQVTDDGQQQNAGTNITQDTISE